MLTRAGLDREAANAKSVGLRASSKQIWAFERLCLGAPESKIGPYTILSLS